MRLIDADALNPKFVHGRWDDRYVSEKEVQDAPTVSPDMAQVLAYECGKDAVQVVQCKDCKHWKRMDNLPKHYGECLDSVFGYCAPREDFFCKNGEREEE